MLHSRSSRAPTPFSHVAGHGALASVRGLGNRPFDTPLLHFYLLPPSWLPFSQLTLLLRCSLLQGLQQPGAVRWGQGSTHHPSLQAHCHNAVLQGQVALWCVYFRRSMR